MAMTLEELEEEAKKLSPAERELLAYRLYENLPPDYEPPVPGISDEELERRERDMDEGRAEFKDFDEVMDRLRAKYAKTHAEA